MKDRFVTWLIPRLIRLIFLFLVNTIRWQVVGEPYSRQDPKRYLYAFWHARMLMIPRISRNRAWHGYMLISEHRDGGYIADTMHLLGIDTVRGSTTRGGARAMLKMLRAVRDENRHLAITPDGPKGPREVVQKGTVQLAMKAGLPVVPVCYATKRHWRVNSWDRFYIPQPFSRGVFVMGDPVSVSEGDDMDDALRRVQQAMDDAQQTADSFFDKA
ncbi:lysophospholipid acyltransferase family protein [Mariprofundus ferrooxydans]|uniref:lysophospholipid acyltransferase family protein n=1 Tax=Mariprofundus ferrooxydans TaxID=314344 RepID=UPI001430F482|nr:lysophospholipid acyltransferase family protein [Mariprofundus ferrooxydans]